MNIFALRRRDAGLSDLKLPETMFQPVEQIDDDLLPPEAPGEPLPVAAANELVTALVALDVAAAVRADAPRAEPPTMPAPLSQRHLETIERMVEHLRADEVRLREQIAQTRRQLADTRLARRGFERNSTELRRGIAALMRQADGDPAAPPRRRPTSPGVLEDLRDPEPGIAMDDGGAISVATPRARRDMH